jgi:hypothetical protein
VFSTGFLEHVFQGLTIRSCSRNRIRRSGVGASRPPRFPYLSAGRDTETAKNDLIFNEEHNVRDLGARIQIAETLCICISWLPVAIK